MTHLNTDMRVDSAHDVRAAAGVAAVRAVARGVNEAAALPYTTSRPAWNSRFGAV